MLQQIKDKLARSKQQLVRLDEQLYALRIEDAYSQALNHHQHTLKTNIYIGNLIVSYYDVLPTDLVQRYLNDARTLEDGNLLRELLDPKLARKVTATRR